MACVGRNSCCTCRWACQAKGMLLVPNLSHSCAVSYSIRRAPPNSSPKGTRHRQDAHTTWLPVCILFFHNAQFSSSSWHLRGRCFQKCYDNEKQNHCEHNWHPLELCLLSNFVPRSPNVTHETQLVSLINKGLDYHWHKIFSPFEGFKALVEAVISIFPPDPSIFLVILRSCSSSSSLSSSTWEYKPCHKFSMDTNIQIC